MPALLRDPTFRWYFIARTSSHFGDGLIGMALVFGSLRLGASPTEVVRRVNAREHISFSAGRHHCLGAALARMEGEVGLRVLFERFPRLRLLPGATRRGTRILRGYEHLPARLAG